MYQVDVTVTCPECGKQWKVNKMAGSLFLVLKSLLKQIREDGLFLPEHSTCRECTEAVRDAENPEAIKKDVQNASI